MKTLFINKSQTPFPRTYLKKWLIYVWSQLKIKKIVTQKTSQNLVVALVTAQESARCNRRFRCRKSPTDVLSFPDLDDKTLGELVLCDSVLKKQALIHGLSFREEMAYCVLHGLLHLLGFEHEKSKKQAQKMYDLQDKLFDFLLSKKINPSE